MKYRVNYSKVITQAGYIMNQAEALSKQIQMLYQMELECRQVWRGEAAEAFIKNIIHLREEMEKTRLQMVNLSSTIKVCADKIQQADSDLISKAIVLKQGH